MPRRPANVTQADVARVLRAVKASGVEATVEIRPDGTIAVTNSREQAKTVPSGTTVEPKREVVLW